MMALLLSCDMMSSAVLLQHTTHVSKVSEVEQGAISKPRF